MKIAITATGNTPNSKVDSRFGRCSYFAIYDMDANQTEFIQNPNKDAASGAGPAAVQLIAKRGVKQVISGEFGGKAKSILEDLNIQMIMLNGPEKSIQEVLDLMAINK
ncbi:NifB/NifX family molybdenum-iron cluster-binding protein [uncultured Sunxiuqinia sp.]|jgi:predicted Fe-Mo cluster-binding NifX family protein|uniref:NifB/NifX family molybdenum-iron cluster-binding protein n=1 Tax=uncultured Sunxiuqinia sp. TaxID=1573825 RepID=UPI0019C844A5|nr:dinitrogenase iron-molybdenum cofactor biosynthesis protein [Sunxiuqinia sp.]|tara:strand:+ start:7505 stop:7828 length:324 start_codon:yes stop_codon:yes gene_type:complete